MIRPLIVIAVVISSIVLSAAPVHAAVLPVFKPKIGTLEISIKFSYGAPFVPFTIQSIEKLEYKISGDGYLYASGNGTVVTGIFGFAQAMQPLYAAINSACAQMKLKYPVVEMVMSADHLRMPFAPDSKTTQSSRCP